ncbi:MAG: WhiB family transcriptional regulator [Microthrixaceae bacterium]
MKPPAWQADAACRQMDTRLFYIGQGESIPPECVEACRRCPVFDDCRAWAIKYELHGFWAGTSGRDRARIRKTMGIARHNPTSLQYGCGTEVAYRRHLRNGERPCERCRRANAIATAERVRASA